MLIAVDAATTHLFKPGLRIHIRRALELGATRDEILEVLQLVSVLGMHSCTVGVPLLVRALDDLGHADALHSDRSRRSRSCCATASNRSAAYWSIVLGGPARARHGLLRGLSELSTVPWRSGVLPPKIKELVYIAADAATTHLFTPGLKLHFRQALDHGATRDEILEVLELVSLIGIHSWSSDCRCSARRSRSSTVRRRGRARAVEHGLPDAADVDEIRAAVRELCADFPGEYWRELEPDRYPDRVRRRADRARLARGADPRGVRRRRPRARRPRA